KQILIKGQVTSLENGESLPGVNILIKGTSTGTVTDVNGNYSLQAQDELGTLVFSFIGHISQEIPIENRSVIDVVLAEDVQSLDEVVVVGYGTQKRETLTGSITTVKGETVQRSPATNLSN